MFVSKFFFAFKDCESIYDLNLLFVVAAVVVVVVVVFVLLLSMVVPFSRDCLE